MTQGTWIALVSLALFAMNVIAKGDLPKYKAVLFGSGQSPATPSPTDTGASASGGPLPQGVVDALTPGSTVNPTDYTNAMETIQQLNPTSFLGPTY